MTIAACYVSDEGVVLGADSTLTMSLIGPDNEVIMDHHYNYAQKIFEFGDPGSTVALMFWGLAALGKISYRTLIAEVADEAAAGRLDTLERVTALATTRFWAHYREAFADTITRIRELAAKGDECTDAETIELRWKQHDLSGGFCVAGRWLSNRHPAAYEVPFEPALDEGPVPERIGQCESKFWGWPKFLQRQLIGIDPDLFNSILESGKWNGTQDDLLALVGQVALRQPRDLPLREAIDWICSSLYTTIKMMKFSHLPPVCGGPVEIAVISSDRPFRWVRHKEMDEAIVGERRSGHDH